MYGLDQAMQAVQSYLAVVKAGAICSIIALVIGLFNAVLLMVLMYRQTNQIKAVEVKPEVQGVSADGTR